MKGILSIIVFFLFTLQLVAQQDPYLKKLGVYSRRMTMKDTSLVNRINKIAQDSVYSNSSKALLYSRTSLNISKSLEYDEGSANSLLVMSRAKIYLNEYDSALYFAEESLKLAKKSHAKNTVLKAHEMIGNVHVYTQSYDKAVNEYLSAIRIGEAIGERNSITSYSNLGLVFLKTKNYAKAREYVNLSLDLSRKYNDSINMATCLNNLGLIEKNTGNDKLAVKYFEEGIEVAHANENVRRESELLYNLANIYFRNKDFDRGFEYFDQSLEISKKNASYADIAISYHTKAVTSYEIGRLKQAEEAGYQAVDYAMLSGNYEIIVESCAALGEILFALGDYNQAYAYSTYAVAYKDSLNLAALNNSVSLAEAKFNNEKKALKDEMLRAQEKKINDEKLRARELLLWLSGFALVVFVIGLLQLIKRNKQVKAKNLTVEAQKEEIEIQHREIKDSIAYAKRIQTALISGKEGWKSISDDVSVFFRPKDVVSGDFYWMHHDESKNISIWAVGDCTGHGVPGAFMSMLGIGYLNEIVVENGLHNPADILDQLRARIVSALTNDQSDSKDGMDIGICVWDKNSNELSFAGANNGMWLIREKSLLEPALFNLVYDNDKSNHVLIEISADKMPIGKLFAVPPPFELKKIKLKPNDVIILFTDGFADQFGGPDDKKFKYRPLKDVLLDLLKNPFNQHEAILEKVFEDWKGKNEQTDDVCIVTLKV